MTPASASGPDTPAPGPNAAGGRDGRPDRARHIALDGAWNFRDVGGYATRDGRHVRWGRLYRADSLHRLTETDLATLEELGVRTVVDLRTPGEVAGGRLSEDFEVAAWHHLPVVDVLPTRESFERWAAPADAARQYLAMMEGAAASVAAFLGVICDAASYPLVYHCFAGKDRTGVLTALVLGLMGVADEDIVADYALSTLAMQHLLEWLRQQYGDSPDLESSARAILAADPATMHAFLDEFRAGHGSFAAYAAGLGHPDAGAQLAAILLEP